MDCAQILFSRCEDLSDFLLRVKAAHMVKAIKIDFKACQLAPIGAVSKVLRSVTSLETMYIDLGQVIINFKHPTFLEEAEDPSSWLSQCVKHAMDLGAEGYKWFHQVIDEKSFEGYTRPPSIIVELFPVGRPYYETEAFEIEHFEICATFNPSTWALEGTHAGQFFSIPQELSERAIFPTELNVISGRPFYEAEIESIMAEYFPDLPITTQSNLTLLNLMHDAHPQDSRSGHKRFITHSVGRALLDSHKYHYQMRDFLDHHDLQPYQISDLWRRILKITDKDLLAKEWKGLWVLVEKVDDKANDSGGMNFEQQQEFFCDLWDVEMTSMPQDSPETDAEWH